MHFLFWIVLMCLVMLTAYEDNPTNLLGPFIHIFLGIVFGFLFGLFNPFSLRKDEKHLKKRVNFLEKSLKRLHQRLNEFQESDVRESSQKSQSQNQAMQKSEEVLKENLSQDQKPVAPIKSDEVSHESQPTVQTKETIATPSESKPEPQITSKNLSQNQEKGSLIDFFAKGNLVAKVGMVLLFIGVGLLLKLAIDYGKFPLSWRLIAVGTGGMVLFSFGFLLRKKRRSYALILQGGGIGIFYINAFAAFRFFDLLPAYYAFAVLVLSVLMMAFLAALQKSQSLAALAILGGFLAPILASTVSGNHIVLFSYYAVLNLGIFILAWFQSWRILNLIGFVFTFGIGSVWGYKYYKPEFFNSVEPFLILSFIYYFSISVLYAIKRIPKNKDLVDATLVFGTPLLFFILQYRLIFKTQYGAFITAISLAALYFFTAFLLWKKYKNALKFFIEVFLALGWIFFTLSGIYLFSDLHLSIFYALEGTGLIILGTKQNRRLVSASGFMLLGLSFMYYIDVDEAYRHEIVNLLELKRGLSPLFLSQLIYGLCVFVGSYFLSVKRKLPGLLERVLGFILLYWGFLFLLYVAAHQLAHLVPKDIDSILTVSYFFFIAVLGFVFEILRRSLKWFDLRYLLNAWPWLIFICYIAGSFENMLDPNWRSVVWAFLLAAQFFYLKGIDKPILSGYQCANHFVTQCLIVLIVSTFLANTFEILLGWQGFLLSFPYLFVPLVLVNLFSFKKINLWPMLQHRKFYLKWIGNFFIALSWICVVFQQILNRAEIYPFSYIPLLNPFDFLMLFFFITVALCRMNAREQNIYLVNKAFGQFLKRFFVFTIWLWLSFMIVRFAHHHFNIMFDFSAIWKSMFVQSAWSIFWSVFAMVMMILATRLRQRYNWLIGAFLLGVVVFKLVLVDLSSLSQVARIVSFLGSGGVFILIGYLSPLPPAKKINEN